MVRSQEREGLGSMGRIPRTLPTSSQLANVDSADGDLLEGDRSETHGCSLGRSREANALGDRLGTMAWQDGFHS